MNENQQLQKTNSSAYELTTFEQVERFAKMLAESDFAPKDYKGKPGNCIIAMQFGHELGLKPMQAIQNIAVIGGRPVLWGDTALALIIANPECKGRVREWTEGKGPDAVAYCEVHRGDKVTTREFSMRQAAKAKLTQKAGPWTDYPERMLQLRARGYALRDSYPDVLKGLWIEGEILIDEPYTESTRENETPKLGLDAVKQAIAKQNEEIIDGEIQSPDEENINPVTGEIDESKELFEMSLSFDEVTEEMTKATTVKELIAAKDKVKFIKLEVEQHKELLALYRKKQHEVNT